MRKVCPNNDPVELYWTHFHISTRTNEKQTDKEKCNQKYFTSSLYSRRYVVYMGCIK